MTRARRLPRTDAREDSGAGWLLAQRRLVRALVGAMLLACAPVTACDDGDTPAADAMVDAGDAGGNAASRFAITVTTGRDTLRLMRDETVLARFGRDAFQLGVPNAVTDGANYDPWSYVGGKGKEPAGLRWLAPMTIDVVAQGGDGARLALRYADGIAAALEITLEADGRWRARWTLTAGADRVALYRLSLGVDASEAFYGLGEYFDHVNHRGHVRAMQMEIDTLESGYNEAHVPIPFFVGTRGWGLFVENDYPAVFDMASRQDDRVEATVGTGVASKDGVTFHLFAAEHPLDVTRHYYEVTGYPKLPARWALGPWIWRNDVAGETQAREDVETIRDLDLATTGYWIDRPYASAVNSFDFDPARYDDAPAMLARMQALGFRVAIWHTPYLEELPATAALREEAESAGYYPDKTGLLLFNSWGKPIDFTRDKARAFWQRELRRYTDIGIEGFKLDYAEDVAVGIGSVRNVWAFSDGSDERTMHAGYQRLYHQTYAEMLPEDGGFLLCRASAYGDQVHGVIVWPGDIDATLDRHREKVGSGADVYLAVGGLPAAVVASLSLGPSGFPFFGSDTGGYKHDPPDEETFTRWFEHTALSSVMQVGTSSSVVPWEYEKWGYSKEVLERYRRYARLHLRLWPYEWSYATQIADTGRPIQRALGLAYPELGIHPDDTYLFGDDLLVAPVVERGARERKVQLPPGDWLDWWTGKRHAGDRVITVAAPLDSLPLFVRTGALVPMLRPSIDALAPTTEPDRVDSYATDAGVLHVRVVPGDAPSAFTLFDGTRLEQEPTEDGVVLRMTPGTEFTQGAVFEIWGQNPTEVTLAPDAREVTANLAAP